MNKQSHIPARTPGGMVMLMLIGSVVAADAATIMQARDVSFPARIPITLEPILAPIFKFIPWSMASITVCWALFGRRRAH